MLRPAVKDSLANISVWKKYRECNDNLSHENLAKQYLYLVEQMAKRISQHIPQRLIPKEDLMGFGYIGLLEAIKKFDYKKGYQFETYGLWRIKGAMLDGLRKMDWATRGTREKAKKLNNALRLLEQQLMREPTEEELSEYLNMPLEEVHQAMATLALSTLLSLDEPVGSNEEEGKQQSRIDQVVDQSIKSHDNQLLMEEFRHIVIECINSMPEKERLVISLAYYEGLAQVEIAEVLNLTKGRISQIHSRATLRLRQSLEAKGFSFDSFQ
ncbi:sigma-70 family RNA polymerase sigma factor [Pseudoneobacillus sp. C159]